MADARKPPKKPVYQAASPFRPPNLTQLGQPHHDVVAGLLVNTLSPIGQYRQSLPKAPLKSKKRKRKSPVTAASSEPSANTDSLGESSQSHATKLPPPAIKNLCLIGFNAVTRHLEDLSRLSRTKDDNEGTKPSHVSSIFLLRPMDDLIYSHLPVLCQTASLAHSKLPPTRLVLLDPSVEPKVATAISQIRGVSVLALLDDLEDSAGTSGLTEYVRANVDAIEVPWLRQIAEGQWLGTTTEVT